MRPHKVQNNCFWFIFLTLFFVNKRLEGLNENHHREKKKKQSFLIFKKGVP